MFTGIIEEQGHIRAITQNEKGVTLTISAKEVLEGTKVGDSINVNGICLTVTSLSGDSFTIDAVPETMSRTNLGDHDIGSAVNLERAATPATRLGGHYVQGHVDTTGSVAQITPDGEALWIRIETDPAFMRYVVEKGYITIDGTSLTVVETSPDWFTVTLIPHTQSVITLPHRQVGERVNLEADIIAKYVEKLVTHERSAP